MFLAEPPLSFPLNSAASGAWVVVVVGLSIPAMYTISPCPFTSLCHTQEFQEIDLLSGSTLVRGS